MVSMVIITAKPLLNNHPVLGTGYIIRVRDSQDLTEKICKYRKPITLGKLFGLGVRGVPV